MLTYELMTFETDLDIAELFDKIGDKDGVILESSMHNNGLGDYSIIAFNKVHEFAYKRGKCSLDGKAYKADVFQELEKFFSLYTLERNSDLPFIGGAIGYLSYDLKNELENLPHEAEELVDIPLCLFKIYNNYVLINHDEKAYYYCNLGINEKKRYSYKEVIKRFTTEEPAIETTRGKGDNIDFHSPYSQESYMQAVENMRQYIKKGHIYIANMTHTFRAEVDKGPYEIYKDLRQVNPAPFSAYFPNKDFTIISSSPERFLKMREGHIETRPIKGTRPRSEDPIRDKIYREELQASEKDKSELLMIVDLERNDLSRVCKPGSVVVEDLFQLEAYPTVYHLVATVKGELRDEYTVVDLLRATFPGGSITGAPKIRAMEVIEELEANKRGIYTGSMGYVGFDGNADFNILIRSVLMIDKKAYIGVGGGITWESCPMEEYEETLTKAKAIFKAIRL